AWAVYRVEVHALRTGTVAHGDRDIEPDDGGVDAHGPPCDCAPDASLSRDGTGHVHERVDDERRGVGALLECRRADERAVRDGGHTSEPEQTDGQYGERDNELDQAEAGAQSGRRQGFPPGHEMRTLP